MSTANFLRVREEGDVEEVPKHWVNCTHRNASYCQYRFLASHQVVLK